MHHENALMDNGLSQSLIDSYPNLITQSVVINTFNEINQHYRRWEA
jgi:hypothetical protein